MCGSGFKAVEEHSCRVWAVGLYLDGQVINIVVGCRDYATECQCYGQAVGQCGEELGSLPIGADRWICIYLARKKC